MPEATVNKTYDTSEENGKYTPVQTNPEEDVIQIHTDGEISGENLRFKHYFLYVNSVDASLSFGCTLGTGKFFWGRGTAEFEHKIRRSNRKINKQNRYGSVPYAGNFGR